MLQRDLSDARGRLFSEHPTGLGVFEAIRGITDIDAFYPKTSWECPSNSRDNTLAVEVGNRRNPTSL